MPDPHITAPVTLAVTSITAPITQARDAYQLALAEGFVGTRQEWLDSLAVSMAVLELTEAPVSGPADGIVITGITDPVASDPLSLSPVPDGVNGKDAWTDGTFLCAWVLGLWYITTDPATTYQATKASAADSPVGLTVWTILNGAGQPTVKAVTNGLLGQFAAVNGVVTHQCVDVSPMTWREIGGGAGVSELGDLDTTGYTAGRYLRVAANPGGVEERTPGDVLSDIGGISIDDAPGFVNPSGYRLDFDTSGLLADREVVVQDGPGTMAYLADIPTQASDIGAAEASHEHVSADITDATSDGSTNPEKILKTNVAGSVTVEQLVAASDISIQKTALIVGNTQANNLTESRNYEEPNADGVKALTASTTGVPDALASGTISGNTTVSAGTTWNYGLGASDAHLQGLGGGDGAGIPLFKTTTYTGTGSARKLLGLDVTDSPTFTTVNTSVSVSINRGTGDGALTLVAGTGDSVSIRSGGSAGTARIGLGSYNVNADTWFYRDASGIFAQRNGTSAQSFRVYHSDTASDDSYFEIDAGKTTDNVCLLRTVKTGTETQMSIVLEGSNRAVAIADVPTGGSATAAANATAINSILAALRSHGIIAT
jgi:hypothetical protein